MAKLTLSFRNKTLKIFPLTEDEMVIGREPACSIHIDSLAAQPMHACIRREGESYRLIALQDDDLPRIGDTAVESHVLADGDHFQIGKHTLTFTTEAPAMAVERVAHPAEHPVSGWLQITNGSNIGRTIHLERALTRLGKAGKRSAMISRRKDGYNLSHLEGSSPPEVNGVSIGTRSQLLRHGDRVRIGKLQLQFFVEGAPEPGADPDPASTEGPQRGYTRVAFSSPASLSQGQATWETQVIDVSVKGTRVAKPEGWDGREGDTYDLTIRLAKDTHVHMSVRVAHMDEHEIGFHCVHIGPDSVAHLRHIVETNLGSAHLLDRDLAALA
jgi:hypothetical protein